MAHALEPKDWSYRPPRKVRIGALKSALSFFAREGRLLILDNLELAEIKTKAFVQTLSILQAGKKSLVVDEKTTRSSLRAFEMLKITTSCRRRASTSMTFSVTIT